MSTTTSAIVTLGLLSLLFGVTLHTAHALPAAQGAPSWPYTGACSETVPAFSPTRTFDKVTGLGRGDVAKGDKTTCVQIEWHAEPGPGPSEPHFWVCACALADQNDGQCPDPLLNPATTRMGKLGNAGGFPSSADIPLTNDVRVVFGSDGNNTNFRDHSDKNILMHGFAGNDVMIFSRQGNDDHHYIESGDGEDVVYGNNGDPPSSGGSRIFVDTARGVIGTSGNDEIFVGDLIGSSANGGSGDDLVVVESNHGPNASQLAGEEGSWDRGDPNGGDDTLIGPLHGSQPSRLQGDAGNDCIYARSTFDDPTNPTKISGGLGDDFILASNTASEWITGFCGQDYIRAGDQSQDTVYGDGALSNPNVTCGFPSDVDTLIGGGTVRGQDGDDRIDPGSGDDTVYGGPGNDEIWGNTGDDSLSGEAGDDQINGGDGNNTLDGGDGADFLWGGGASDTLAGGDGADQLLGGAGIDWLDGGLGPDSLFGGDDEDALEACDGGADQLYGEGGYDNFVFEWLLDTIWDSDGEPELGCP